MLYEWIGQLLKVVGGDILYRLLMLCASFIQRVVDVEICASSFAIKSQQIGVGDKFDIESKITAYKNLIWIT